ncbi:MAG: hypothetical protein FWG02_08635 [Holophagaceae bacterium]|nr:hypothetical protein [Holophagaceae bacterium]
MFKLANKLKAFALLVTLCSCLSAQDIKVAVVQPGGSEGLLEERNLVRDQLATAITGTKGFQLFDRVNTDKIMIEHFDVRTTGLFGPNEARALGSFKGVDYLIFSELSMLQDGAIRIVIQGVNVETAHIAGSENRLVSNPTSELIMYATRDLMSGLLKKLIENAPGTVVPPGQVHPLLVGLDNEIRRLLINNRSNPKWNSNKTSYELEVDLLEVNVEENRQYRTSRVTGRITFIVTDATGKSATAELDLVAFTEMGKELVQKKIREQVQPKINNIIKDLLDGLM